MQSNYMKEITIFLRRNLFNQILTKQLTQAKYVGAKANIVIVRNSTYVYVFKQLAKWRIDVSIVLYCIVLYCIVLYCIVLYCIVLYCIVLYCIALHCIALHCIALHCIALHCLHCIALHCIALHCIVIPRRWKQGNGQSSMHKNSTRSIPSRYTPATC